jgi:hypothetical protein
MLKTLALIASIAGTPAFAQSLCKAGETVVFVCRAKTEIVSACASKDVSPHGGSLQFRVGTSLRTADSWPASRKRTNNVVTFGYAYVGQGPPGHHVALFDGRDVYGIITTDERGPQYGGEESAFVWMHDGKPAASAICDALTSPTDAGLDLLDKAGFQNVDSDTLVLP